MVVTFSVILTRDMNGIAYRKLNTYFLKASKLRPIMELKREREREKKINKNTDTQYTVSNSYFQTRTTKTQIRTLKPVPYPSTEVPFCIIHTSA